MRHNRQLVWYDSYGVGEACTSKCDDAFSDMLLGYWNSFRGTIWMEWTYNDPWGRYSEGVNGPVHSGYLHGSGSWVYQGGIASNFSDWAGFQQGFVWAWAKADELMGDAEAPARAWYEQNEGAEWGIARETCRGDHQFSAHPLY